MGCLGAVKTVVFNSLTGDFSPSSFLLLCFCGGFLSKHCLLCNFSIDLNIFEMAKSSDLKLIKNRLQKKVFCEERELLDIYGKDLECQKSVKNRSRSIFIA